MQRPERTVRPRDRLIEDDSTSTEESKIEATELFEENTEENDNDSSEDTNSSPRSDTNIMAPSISSLDSNIIKFLEICTLGTTNTDPIPLVFEQERVHSLENLYMLEDDAVWADLVTYDDGNGPHPMPKFLIWKLLNAKLWIHFKLADENADAVQALTKEEFETWLHQLSVGRINRTAVINAIGTANMSNGPSTSTLSPTKLLDNWNRTKRTYSSTLDVFKENHQFTTFKRDLTMDL